MANQNRWHKNSADFLRNRDKTASDKIAREGGGDELRLCVGGVRLPLRFLKMP